MTGRRRYALDGAEAAVMATRTANANDDFNFPDTLLNPRLKYEFS
jgi:hypothetical protein